MIGPAAVVRLLWVLCCGVLFALGLGNCGLDECATLRQLCQERCAFEVKRACLEIAAQGDEKICRASYRGYARYCPDWDLFDDD
jgi:hypothetical protein